MTLILAIKVREGIVLAAESRRNFDVGHSDDAIKLLYFKNKNHRHVGALVSGGADIEGRTPHELLPEVESTLPPERMTIRQYAEKFRFGKWNVTEERFPPPTTFLVAGFDKEEPIGRVYSVVIPYDVNNPQDPNYSPQVKELLNRKFDIKCFGWSEIIKRLYKGYPCYSELATQVALQKKFSSEQTEQILQILKENALPEKWKSCDDLSLQEAVELAYFFMQTTIDAQKFMNVRAVCGGAIHVCTITQDKGLKLCHRRDVLKQHV
jgi:hypothetical protein